MQNAILLVVQTGCRISHTLYYANAVACFMGPVRNAARDFFGMLLPPVCCRRVSSLNANTFLIDRYRRLQLRPLYIHLPRCTLCDDIHVVSWTF